MSNYNNQYRNNFNRNNQHGGNNNNSITVDAKTSYINPYNFVSLNESGCKRESKDDRKGDLTGYIECTLTTKTETIVPNIEGATSEEIEIRGRKFPFYTYPFFNYGIEKNGFKVPVIPGSEIRGMLRTDFEVFTDSCMSTVDAKKSFISRTKEVKNPGILKKDENGKWHLYEAKRYALHTTRRGGRNPLPREAKGRDEAIYMVDKNNKIRVQNKEYKTGDRVKFDCKENDERYVKQITNSGKKDGILFIGELGGKKTRESIHDSIFTIGNEITKVKNVNECVEKLEEMLDMYNDSAFNKNLEGSWYAGYDIKNSKELPVWYSKLDNQNRTYLSLAAIGKEAYHRTLNELLEVTSDKDKTYMPCISNENLCKACGLFGFVSDKDAKGSKIRISDAIYVGENNPYSSKRVIPELASPHIANSAFYSLYMTNSDLIKMQQNIDWNYDFKFSGNNTEAINPEEITIRGRKMYWHHRPKINNNEGKANRNCAIIPVKEGSSFKFKVYFENVKKEYLDELISVINLNYKSDIELNNKPYYDLCHKIGKAKPLGYGSIKVDVDDVKIRELQISNAGITYEMINYEESTGNKLKDISLNSNFKMDADSMIEALRIYNFNYLEDNYLNDSAQNCIVTYPKALHSKRNGESELASHYWFMDIKSSSVNNPYIIMTLPQIIEGKEKALNKKGIQGTIRRAGREVNIDGLKLPKFIKN